MYNEKKFKSKLNNFVNNKKNFSEIKVFIDSQLFLYPQEDLKIKASVFTELKDLYTADVVDYGYDVATKKPFDRKFIDVLAVRYRRLGNLFKYNVLNDLVFERNFFESKLKYMKLRKEPFKNVKNLAERATEKYPSSEIVIKAAVFATFKDMYTSECLVYGEDVVRKDPSNRKFRDVFCDRYKRVFGKDFK